MGSWDSIAEAKIKEWQQRKRDGEESEDSGESGPTVESIETQLFDKIVAARRAARETDDAQERAALLEYAKKTKIRLMVLLEKGGFPLLARSLEQRLDEAIRQI